MDLDALPDEWTDEQNALFSRVFMFMDGNQKMCTHPEGTQMEDRHWRTIAWNAAFVAANGLCETELTIVDDNENILASEVNRSHAH